MLGIIFLAIIYMWILMGNRMGLVYKIIAALLILGSYIYFLLQQGVPKDEILEILFSFDFYHRI